MSYILDALKKSEQLRGHGSIPNVQTVHSSSLNYRGEKKAYWPYLLIIAVMLNLIAIVYFIIDKDSISENNTMSVQDTTLDNNAQTVTPGTPKKSIDSTTATNTSVELKKNETHLSATAVKKKIANSEIIIASSNSNANSNTAANKRPAPAQKNIIDFYDLPASIQQQLPAIVVSAHIYSSNPLQRSIVINNNFLEEGEYVIDNMILHEITADGAIFDYEETRFHYSVVSGWQ